MDSIFTLAYPAILGLSEAELGGWGSWGTICGLKNMCSGFWPLIPCPAESQDSQGPSPLPSPSRAQVGLFILLSVDRVVLSRSHGLWLSTLMFSGFRHGCCSCGYQYLWLCGLTIVTEGGLCSGTKKASAFTCCVILDKDNFSEPQFPHILNGLTIPHA